MAMSDASESMRFLDASVHRRTMLRRSKWRECWSRSSRRLETSSYSPVQSASWSNRMPAMVECMRTNVPGSAS